MKSATLDTNILPAEELLLAAEGIEIDVAVVSVTEREVKDSSFQSEIEGIETLSEIGILDESHFGFVFGREGDYDRLKGILKVISSGSFPYENRRNLSSGQRHQLRDALVLEAHIRNEQDIFVTNDARGFVNDGKREIFEDQFQTQIMTETEFLAYCRG